jgi:hypothetical protein
MKEWSRRKSALGALEEGFEELGKPKYCFPSDILWEMSEE